MTLLRESTTQVPEVLDKFGPPRPAVDPPRNGLPGVRQVAEPPRRLAFVGAVLGVAFAWSASRLLLAMISTESARESALVPIRVG